MISIIQHSLVGTMRTCGESKFRFMVSRAASPHMDAISAPEHPCVCTRPEVHLITNLGSHKSWNSPTRPIVLDPGQDQPSCAS